MQVAKDEPMGGSASAEKKSRQLTSGVGNLRAHQKQTMLHLIWYLIVGLIAGFLAKSAMHMHMTLIWTIILGIVGSIVGGFITHLFARPKPGAPFHPAGIIFSILGAILVLWVSQKMHLHLPKL